MIKIIFWFSIALLFYSYAGYPMVLFILERIASKKVRKGVVRKDVSVVLAVKNEEKNIKRRIDNLLNQTYRNGQLEIIIVSDGSTDSTDDIIRRCAVDWYIANQEGRGQEKREIKFIPYSPSQGKPYALNVGVEEASGEIIVFADARQEYDAEAIGELVSNFNDPSIGCVSGELIFSKNHDSTIEQEVGVYWNYEKWIRKTESSIHSLPGATGAIYAIRKSLFKPMPKELLLDDVYVPMTIVCTGKRAIFDHKAIAYDSVSKSFNDEKRRKVRTLLGNWQLLAIMPNLLHPFRNPIFFQYLSHKVFGRLIVPFCFVSYVVTSVFIDGWFYKAVFFSTLGLFALPLLPSKVINIHPLQKICSATKMVLRLNYFSLVGFWYFLTRKDKIW